MKTTTIKLTAEYTEWMQDVINYVNSTFGTFAKADKNGVVTVSETKVEESNGWDTHTAIENADWIKESLTKEGFTHES